jgi:hypothetical protein
MSSSEETSQSPMCTYIGQVCHHHYKPVNQCMPSSTVFDTHHLGGKLVLQDGLWSQSNIYESYQHKLCIDVRQLIIDAHLEDQAENQRLPSKPKWGAGEGTRRPIESQGAARTALACDALGFVQITSFSYRNRTIPTLSH